MMSAALGLLCTAVAAGGEPLRDRPFTISRTHIRAHGGAWGLSRGGYDALFTNPAGLALGGSLTLPALDVWTYSRPESIPFFLEAVGGSAGQDAELLSALDSAFTGNGFGVGGSAGVGFVGGGLGLGLLVSHDSYFFGDSFPLGLSGFMQTELAFVAGYAALVDLGPVSLVVGANVRPLVRIHALVESGPASLLVDRYLGVETGSSGDPFSAMPAYNGTGIAVDLGLGALFGPFSVDVAARDFLGTRIRYSLDPMSEVLSALSQFGLPAVKNDDLMEAVVPMSLSIGLAYLPDLGAFSSILRPSLRLRLADIFLHDGERGHMADVLSSLRLGMDVKLFDFFSVRAGWAENGLSVGAGLSIFFLDVEAAVFTSGRAPDGAERAVTGVSLGAAFGF